MHFLSATTAALVLLLPSALGHNIQLPAHGRDCFHEDLHKDDKMTVTFQVGDREFGSAGNLDIDFWIQDPTGQYEVFQKDVSNGDFSFDAKSDGRYIYCFGNEHWGANSKEVSFNVHGIVYVNEHEAEKDPLETEGAFSLEAPAHSCFPFPRGSVANLSRNSPSPVRSPQRCQGRAVIHRHARAHSS
jgi:p24 family protein beta-1